MRRLLSVILLSGVVLAACGGTDDAADSAPTVPEATGRVELTALAGPVCPVETDPPSPDCADRPVPDAVVVVTDSAGSEVSRGVTGIDGTLVLEVPIGELTVTPQAVEGLLGTASPITISIAADQAIRLTVGYDTGIR